MNHDAFIRSYVVVESNDGIVVLSAISSQILSGMHFARFAHIDTTIRNESTCVAYPYVHNVQMKQDAKRE